jgi:hypothetical protein
MWARNPGPAAPRAGKAAPDLLKLHPATGRYGSASLLRKALAKFSSSGAARSETAQ